MQFFKYWKRYTTTAWACSFCLLVSSGYSQAVWSPTKALNSDAYTDTVHNGNFGISSGAGTMVAAWNSGDSGVVISRSITGGHTWVEAPPIANVQGPYIVYVGPGKWHIFLKAYDPGSNSYINKIVRSTDDGISWSAPTSVSNFGKPRLGLANNNNGVQLGAFPGANTDDPVTIIKSLDGGLTWTTEGTISMLAPKWTKVPIVHCIGSNWMILSADAEVFLSDDDGASWTSSGIATSLREFTFEKLESNHNGTLVAASSQNSPPAAGFITLESYVSTSSDNGQTWSPNVHVHSQTESDYYLDSMSRLEAIPYILPGSNRSWTLLTFNYLSQSFSNKPMKPFMVRSFDDGITWGTPVEVVSDTGSWEYYVSFVYLVTASNDNIVVSYGTYEDMLHGRSTGSDNDIFYRVFGSPAPRAAAHDWELYQ